MSPSPHLRSLSLSSSLQWYFALVFRLLVHESRAGGVIGKQGSKIKQMRESTGARIRMCSVPPTIPSEERLLVISSPPSSSSDPSPAETALFAMFPAALLPQDGPHPNQNRQQQQQQRADESSRSVLNLLVPASQSGALIGKGGRVIKDIRESSGAFVRITDGPASPFALPADRLVQVTATAPKLEAALKAIASVLKANPPQEPLEEMETAGSVAAARSTITPYAAAAAAAAAQQAAALAAGTGSGIAGLGSGLAGGYGSPGGPVGGLGIPPAYGSAGGTGLYDAGLGLGGSGLGSGALGSGYMVAGLGGGLGMNLGSSYGGGGLGGGGGGGAAAAGGDLSWGLGMGYQGGVGAGGMGGIGGGLGAVLASYQGAGGAAAGAGGGGIGGMGSGTAGGGSLTGFSSSPMGHTSFSSASGAAGYIDASGYHPPSGYPTSSGYQPSPGAGFDDPSKRRRVQDRPFVKTEASEPDGHGQGQGQARIELRLPGQAIGSVLGKGGNTIKNIRQMSGANIKIQPSEEGTTDRIVEISGNPTQVSSAEALIKACAAAR
ncbi:unnamed protein product [Closterium sp. Naga37s-1]|nr:unnamed protein product [Closterium sp. Naga37s-1]